MLMQTAAIHMAVFRRHVCARLGGWTGYYGKPGPIVTLQGLLALKAMLSGWRIARDV